jgi:hypothetical protein
MLNYVIQFLVKKLRSGISSPDEVQQQNCNVHVGEVGHCRLPKEFKL